MPCPRQTRVARDSKAICAALIGAARDLGLGPWPRRPLDGRDLALAAGLITLAALPHVLLVASRLRPGRIGVTG